MYKKILVPLDLSEESEGVLRQLPHLQQVGVRKIEQHKPGALYVSQPVDVGSVKVDLVEEARDREVLSVPDVRMDVDGKRRLWGRSVAGRQLRATGESAAEKERH